MDTQVPTLLALLRRSGLRLMLTLVLAAPVAAAAEAAGPDSPPPLPSEREPAGELPEEVESLAGWNIETERADRKPERPRGPLHPVTGEVDYGDAAAAFGNARGRPHEGQDVFAPPGSSLIAPVDGVVIEGGSDGGRGNWVAIYDPKRKRTYNYFHMIEPASVAAGKTVKAGQKVGEVGCTGSCSGDHLHFEIRQGRGPYGAAVNPLPFLEKTRHRG
jgi:murein DD-endopeptidase MepM/ murein hydrolase activator NlpD